MLEGKIAKFMERKECNAEGKHLHAKKQALSREKCALLLLYTSVMGRK
jgi:hypothetical protein